MSAESVVLDAAVQIINQMGFPIFVVLWFMYRSEKIISANTEALTELSRVVTALAEKLNDDEP